MDRYRFDAETDQNFHVNADPDLDPDWLKRVLILMRILPQVLHVLGKNCLFFGHSIASLQYFVFLITVKCVIM